MASPPPPSSNALLCVEYPGKVENVERMIETLGGKDNLAKVYDEPNRRMELRFRPKDVFAKPTCGERSKETSFLLKVKRMRKKKKHPGEEDQFKLKTEVMGAVDCTFKFQNLCDFQYLPAIKEGDSYKPIYDQVFFNKLVPTDWIDAEPASPLFLPPAAFSRMDLPQDYQYRRETAGDKSGGDALDTPYNIIGRTRQRRSHHAIFVTFDVSAVPDRARDVALSQLKVKFIAQRDQEEVKKHFEERPVWSKNALNALTGISPERLKFILPALSYYFTTGPWRNQWVKFGYDPRKSEDAAEYQTLDYRVRLQGGARHKVKAKRSYANYLLPYKAMNWSKPKTSVIDKDTFSSLNLSDVASKDKAASSRETAEEEELRKDIYIFRSGRIPPYRQMFYQFRDLMLDEAQDLLKVSRSRSGAACDEKNGWYLPGTDHKLREILTKSINVFLAKEREAGADDVGEAVMGEDEEEEEEEEEEMSGSSGDEDEDEEATIPKNLDLNEALTQNNDEDDE